MPSRSALRRGALGLAVFLGILLVTFGVAYAVTAPRGSDRVARNVSLAGRPVGRLPAAQLDIRLAALADELRTAEVRVEAPGGGFTVDAQDIGLRLDVAKTRRNVLQIGRTGGIGERIGAWLKGFTGTRGADVAVRADEAAVYAVVAERDEGKRKPATEPSIRWSDGGFEVVDGKDGEGIDPRDVLDGLDGAADGGTPLVVAVDRGTVAPRFDRDDAERVATEAGERVDEALSVRVDGTREQIPLAMLRTWITAEPADEGLRLAVRRDKAMKDLEKTLADVGTPPVETRFDVVGGGVRIIPGRAGTACCAPGAVDAVERAVRRGDDGPVELPLRSRDPSLTVAEAEQLGIKEVVGTFTTRHKAGEPRVQNIHRIADILRGTVIRPGATFSVNRTVGRRTKERGFVAAPVIEEGMFSEGVGGGISQFATTLFNAAFFAGLEFGEYQAHSIYINRYPYGREATLSFPHPDLEIENPSPHGVLIWPTYTSTSITVTLYSTRWATAEQTGQSTAPRGACTRVTTERTRRFVDGRTEIDRVYATYRPREGVNC